MTMPHNVEPSAFHRGQYVGHDSTRRPGVWRIKRRPSGHGWYAARYVGGSGPTSDGFHYGRTLAEVGAKLAALTD
jgi:hypothetical protein